MIDAKHPEYTADRVAEWRLMRDAMDGESAIKSRAEVYLPKPSGFKSQPDRGAAMYSAYRKRAGFPELVAPAVSAMNGVAHAKEITPKMLEGISHLWEDADGKGTPLEELHRQITRELLIMGRYSLLAGAPSEGGEPILTGYTAEQLINWDRDFAVLDESGPVRVGYQWQEAKRFRALSLQDGKYTQQIQQNNEAPQEDTPSGLGGASLDFVPFATASAVDLKPGIRPPPMIGVARAAVTIYQLDADYRHQLYNSGQETLLVINGTAPDFVGAGAVVTLTGGEGAKAPDMKYVGPDCVGIEAHKVAKEDARKEAAQAGAKLLDQGERAQESGEARALRFQADTASLLSIVHSSCALLEAGLRFAARIKGLPTDNIVVPSPKTLMDSPMTPTEAEALMRLWLEGGISYQTFYENLQRGGLASPERDHDAEFKQRDAEGNVGEDEDEGDAPDQKKPAKPGNPISKD